MTDVERKCPKCGCKDVLTERRPDGESICCDCNYMGPTKEFDKTPEPAP